MFKQLIKILLIAVIIVPVFSATSQDIYTADEIQQWLEQSGAAANSAALMQQYRDGNTEAAAFDPADTDLLEQNFNAFLDNPSNFFTGPEETDIGFIMTQKLVGSPANYALDVMNGRDGVDADESITAFTYLARIASYLAVFVVAVLIGYIGIGGLLNQAKDGEFLGRDWDSMFVPLRTLNAGLGTLPVPFFGGLSLSQMFILIVFLFGLGAGSATFTAMAPVLMGKPLVMASFDEQKIEELARSILATQVCAIAQARRVQDGSIQELRSNPWTREDNGSRVLFYPSVVDSETCGYVSADIPNVDDTSEADVGFFSGASWTALLQTGSGLTNNGYIKALMQKEIMEQMAASNGAIAEMYRNLWPIANFAMHPNHFAEAHRQVANGSGDEKWSLQYWRALDTFKLRLNSYSEAAMQTDMISTANEGFTDLVAQNGMMLGGSYYYLITRRQAAMSQAIEDAMPGYKTVDIDRLRKSPWYADMWDKFMSFFSDSADAETSDPITDGVSVVDSVIESAYRVSPDASFALGRANEALSGSTGSGDFFSMMGQDIAEASTGIARIGVDSSAANPDPILEMHSLGNKIQTSLLTAWGIGKFASSSSKAGKVASIFKNMTSSKDGGLSVGGLVFAAMLSSLLLVTFLYSTIIPMLPLIMFAISAMGLFLLLIKALIAAPFWWAMHAHPSGRDLIGKAGTGYPLLLTLGLSPVLMVMGLIGAIALTRLSGWFVNIMMMPSITMMNNGLFSPTGWVAYFVGYGIIMLVIVYKNFGLIYELRQVVLKWMGVDSAYTDFGEKDAQMKAVGLGAYASSVISKGESSMGSKKQ